MIKLLFLIPIASAVLNLALRNTKASRFIGPVSALLMTVVGAFISLDVYSSGHVADTFILSFHIDSLNLIILDVSLILNLLISVYSVKYLEFEVARGKIPAESIWLYHFLIDTFVFSMVLALTTSNMGVLWIGVEATTLASAFLVGFYNDRMSLEASWKYIIICSVGIAVALLGVILLHLSSIDVVHGTRNELSWVYLLEHAASLSKEPLRLSFIFILVGYGTKAGLSPMHTWLPDAYSESPSSVSALLSGVLVNISMYGLIRELSIVNKAIGSSFTSALLMGVGLLSVLTAAFFIASQKDCKRMVAYSSIEHMGIISFALGIFTPASIAASLMHTINHAFTKSLLFLSLGDILIRIRTREIPRITGLIKTHPVQTAIFFIASLAILGAPPFSIFTSEVGVIGAAAASGSIVATALMIILLAIIFTGFIWNVSSMAFGNAPEDDHMHECGELAGKTNLPGMIVMGVMLAFILACGLFMPPQVLHVINDAQRIVMGG